LGATSTQNIPILRNSKCKLNFFFFGSRKFHTRTNLILNSQKGFSAKIVGKRTRESFLPLTYLIISRSDTKYSEG